MSDIKSFEIRNNVSKTYASIAKNGGSCCCGSSLGASPLSASQKMGYSSEELETVPDGANLGLGCGNPQVIASLQPGETVVDLGSGGGFDCFLAARKVGTSGRVIGVDMTPEIMLKDSMALCSCVSGAISKEQLEKLLKAAGFTEVSVTLQPESRELIKTWFPDAEKYVCSASIRAVKQKLC